LDEISSFGLLFKGENGLLLVFDEDVLAFFFGLATVLAIFLQFGRIFSQTSSHHGSKLGEGREQ
jgi:hypothetical protein